jgi:hypothetical protein
MRIIKGKFIFSGLVILISILASLTSCGYLYRSRLFEEYDVVKTTMRYRQEYYFNDVEERRTPFQGLHKTMLKEVAADGQEMIVVFDRLNLSLGSFKPQTTVYLLIDGLVIPLKSIDPEQDVFTRISEDKKDILTADSTTVSIVTGYSTHQSRQVRYQYSISPEIMAKMQNARTIAFRYYAGPSMMTVKFGPRNLKNLKNLIRV